MTDKELAEEYVRLNCDDSLNSFRGQELKEAFIAGLKAQTQWHNLRKNPEDLPTDYRDVFIFYGYGDLDNSYCIGYYSIGNKVWCENPDEDAIKLPVIAWCELPTFKE